MNLEHVNKLARMMYKTELPFWGDFDKQDATTQTRFFDAAQELIELLNDTGFELVEKNDTAIRSGDTPDQSQKSK